MSAVVNNRTGIGTWLRTHVRIRRERSGVWILNAVLLVTLAVAAPNFYGAGNIRGGPERHRHPGHRGRGNDRADHGRRLRSVGDQHHRPGPDRGRAGRGRRQRAPASCSSPSLAGAVLGLVNGLIITRGRVAPFVATLGTLFVFGSIGAIISQGNALTVTNPFVLQLGTGTVFACCRTASSSCSACSACATCMLRTAAYRAMGARVRAATCARRMSLASTCAGSMSASSCCRER